MNDAMEVFTEGAAYQLQVQANHALPMSEGF